MAKLQPGRWSVDVPDGTIVFIVGMRINRLSAPQKWLPVFMAMTRMLIELRRHPELGRPRVRQFASGRTLISLQYWQSWDDLHAYSRNADRLHLPAWKAFNRMARSSSAVGVFHETYVTREGQHEAVFVNMPVSGIARATVSVPAGDRGDSALHRLDPSEPDEMLVP